MAIWLTENPEANELLDREPLALLIGMLLDQQIQIEIAFLGPKKLLDRLGSLDANTIADYDQEKFLALCSTPPAIHRFPGSMGKRVQALCQAIVEEYDGRAENIWTQGGPSGTDITDPASLQHVRAYKKEMKAAAKAKKG
jgi:uncharacterized HhH-GPD family protein